MWNKLGWLISFWTFLWEGLSSFKPKGFYYSYGWSCSLCERRTSFCMGLISRKLCRFLLMFSTCFAFIQLYFTFFHFFFLYQSPLLPLCTVFYSISSNRDEVLSIDPSANVFVFGDFNVDQKDWLTHSGKTDWPGELSYNFSVSNDLTQMVNFPARIPDCDSYSPALLDLFLLFWH